MEKCKLKFPHIGAVLVDIQQMEWWKFPGCNRVGGTGKHSGNTTNGKEGVGWSDFFFIGNT